MSRGHDRERAVRKLLEAQGWVVARCAGSKGDYDLMAMQAHRTNMLVEVKSTSAGPFCDFGPADRADLSEAAALGGANAWLAWWPPRQQLRWYAENEWPKAKTAA